uniref:Uncharacterized protein n=1 Tax=Anguilla anguilla TaxID=7936 RepID=A0A0E9Q5F3_ANGAN
MEKWIPKTSDSFPHLSLCAGQSVWSNLTDKKTSPSQATLGRPCSVNSLPTLVSPEVRYTILDRIGHPVNTNMRVASPGQQLQEVKSPIFIKEYLEN